MIRTITFLPKQLYADIQRLAEQAGKPSADVLRDLVRRGLESRRQEAKPATRVTLRRDGSPRHLRHGLQALANLRITGGPKDLSTKADHYLYGEG